MNVEENLNNKFGNWNPMKNDYDSKEFNHYNTGPGAALSNLQTGQQSAPATQQKENRLQNAPTPFLLFKNVPAQMTKSALFNICARHGRVTSVRDSQKNDYFFANFASVSDLEAVYRGLENNDYGFKVLVGRPSAKKTNAGLEQMEQNFSSSPAQPPAASADNSTGIDYESRTLPVSHTKNHRPRFDNNRILNVHQNHLNLFLDDAHNLEREGLYKPNDHHKFKYNTGRSFIRLPKKTQEFINNKHAESSGHYSPSKGSFIHNSGNMKRPSKIQKCSQCNRQCDTTCSRCLVYYCGIECQKNDWQNHRYICGKPKNLQKIPPTNGNTARPNDEKPTTSKANGYKTNAVKSSSPAKEVQNEIPRSGNIVTITAITKTNVVFIRSKTIEDNTSYFKTIDGLQALGSRNKLKPLTKLPDYGTVVIAHFEEQYQRAMVLNVKDEEKIFVLYMDYGNLDNQKLEHLYEAPQSFIETPRHALPVILKDVPDCYMTESIRKFMYSYLNGISVYLKYKKPADYISEKQTYQVELIDETTQQNLNKMIIKLSQPVEPKTTEDICYKNFLESKIMPSGENIELVVLDNSLMTSGCISCTTKAYALEIQKFQVDLQNYAENLPKEAYGPRVNELCIAQYEKDGRWYRGLCLEVVGDGHPTILFIDYGNINMIHIDKIRRYPSQFDFPLFRGDCAIEGLPEACNDEIVAKLEELIPNGSTLMCKSVKNAFEDEQFYSIELPDVIDKLTQSGLLKK